MMKPREAYDELVNRGREVDLISSCKAVLQWDHQVNMPAGGGAFRARQLSFLSGWIHEKQTDPRIGELLDAVEGSELIGDPESIEAATVREFRRTYDRETRLPRELVTELNKTTTLAHSEWATARKNADFKAFQPWLERIVELSREKAEAYGYEGEPYDALLEHFEPGLTAEEISVVFDALRVDLVDLLGRISRAPKKPDESILKRDYDVERQRVFAEMVASTMGFDFTQGRLDVSIHPFTTGFGPGDTRITTRYNPQRITDGLYGAIHEAGHALYEMGLEKDEHFGTPVGHPASLGIHESQSRMWENLVGRSREFWRYFLPQAKRIFRDALHDVDIERFYGAVNAVTPSFIRVEADEVTYNLHVLLRVELERALIKKDLNPSDVPCAWNDRFENYLGLKVENDADGCLQDVHWSAGLIGYFPTYALGNIYAAQFFAAAQEEIPDLTRRFESGDFLCLREWLRENIHKHGQRYRAEDLCRRIAGRSLSHKPLIEYMNRKYGDIYGF